MFKAERITYTYNLHLLVSFSVRLRFELQLSSAAVALFFNKYSMSVTWISGRPNRLLHVTRRPTHNCNHNGDIRDFLEGGPDPRNLDTPMVETSYTINSLLTKV